MAARRISPSQEDYLEAVYEIEADGQPVRVTDLALRLDVSKASVNKAVSLLKDTGLVNHEHYGTITLTEQGRSTAKEVSLRHKTLKRFLVRVLGVEDAIAEEDACQMEHAISQTTMDRLLEFLDKTKQEQLTQ